MLSIAIAFTLSQALTSPPKGFTKFLWKKPTIFEKGHDLVFAYALVKLPVIEKEHWITIGSYLPDGNRWTFAIDTNEDKRTDDETSALTGQPTTEIRNVRRTAKGEWTFGQRKVKLSFEFLDQYFGVTGDIERDRMISVRVKKG